MKRHLRPRYLGPGDTLTAKAVFWILVALFTATLATPSRDLDSLLLLQTAHSFVAGERGELNYDQPGAWRVLNAAPELLEDGVLKRRGDPDAGALVWGHEFGNSLSALPFVFAGEWIGRAFPALERRYADLQREGREDAPEPRALGPGERSPGFFAELTLAWRDALLAAATCFLAALGILRLGRTRRQAFWVALGLGACSFLWVEARQPGPQVQAMFLCVLSVYALIAVRERFLRFERPSFWLLGVLGASLAALVLTRGDLTLCAVGLFGAGVQVIARGRRRLWSSPLMKARAGTSGALRDLAWLGLPLVLGGIAALFAEGGLARLGVHATDAALAPLLVADGAALFERAGLLLLSPGRGLVWFGPLVLLAPLGLWRHRHDRLLVFCVLWCSVAVLGAAVAREDWHGSVAFGPKLLLPVLPLLWIAAALAFDSRHDVRRSRRAAMWLGAFGALCTLGGVAVDRSTYTELALQSAAAEARAAEQAADTSAPASSGAAAAASAAPAGPAPESESSASGPAGLERVARLQWEGRYAQPWAHWRILRHRVALPDMAFPAREVFFSTTPAVLRATSDRQRDFQHLAWQYLDRRLDGIAWPLILACVALLGLGVVQALRGLDPTRP